MAATYLDFYRGASQMYAEVFPSLRFGQALMSYLNKVDPGMYVRVPKNLDPYYDDDLCQDFLSWVYLQFTNR